MPVDPQLLVEAIGEIYAAVGNPSGFEPALERIRAIFRASRVAMVARLTDHACLHHADRPLAKGEATDADTPQGPGDISILGSRVAFELTKSCSECMNGRHASRLCSCAGVRNGSSMLPSVHLSVYRASECQFDKAERDDLTSLASHILRAVYLSHRLEVSETACELGNQVLEEVRRGIIVLNERKEVVFMNRQAEGLCTELRGVTAATQPSGCRKVRAGSPQEDLLLQRAIDCALEHGSPNTEHSPAANPVRIGNAHTGQPMLFRVTPLRLPPGDEGKRRAVLFIDDLARKESGDDRLLTTLFGLTRAEVRVARALLAGLRPKQIAAHLAVSEDTVRTQLRAVYAKTETRGIASLVALLSRLAEAPPFDICDAAVEPTRLRRPSLKVSEVGLPV